MAASNAPEQNSVTTRDTLISTISTRAVLLGAYVSYTWETTGAEVHPQILLKSHKNHVMKRIAACELK
jgi:hypothetical protein